MDAAASMFARAERARFVSELVDLVRFPSVGADPLRRRDMARCAGWLARHLASIGFDRAEVMRARRVGQDGHPVVYAEWRGAPRAPTLLVYGHYDVQPEGPIGEWSSPPFDPVVRGGVLVGRGASDDKGQLFAHVKALESYLATSGALPINVKCVFEGEEEIGSPSLASFFAEHRRLLAADVAVVSDSTQAPNGRPSLTYAARGQVALDVEVRALSRDLHCGIFGGAVPNAAEALAAILARLHHRDGRIAIPGFYDRVCDLDPRERAEMAAVGPSDAEVLASAGARAASGERRFSLYERQTARPALNVNGIASGHGGAGTKAIVPARASAKLTFRIVADQDPADVARRARAQIQRIAPRGVDVTVTPRILVPPALVDRRHPAMGVAAGALARAFGAAPVFLRSGGTLPAISALQRVLGVPCVLMGFATPVDRLHAPGERFSLASFSSGIDACIDFYAGLRRRSALRGRSSFSP